MTVLMYDSIQFLFDTWQIPKERRKTLFRKLFTICDAAYDNIDLSQNQTQYQNAKQQMGKFVKQLQNQE